MITTKTVQMICFLSFPSFCTSIIPFLLADSGLMRFPHFRKAIPGGAEAAVKFIASLLGDKECGKWVRETARLPAAA